MSQKAFICGINAYAGAPLNGCLNDVADWWKIVTELGGFPPDNVRAVCDDRADSTGIRDRMHWLRDGAVAGDEVLWAYSGHGSEVRRRDIFNGELSEVVDQCICPVNINDPDYWDTGVITDKEIRDWLVGFPAGVKITIILDCCHSGTGTRELNPHPVRSRYLQPPLDIRLRHRAVGDVRKDLPVLKAGRGMPGSEPQTILGPGIIAVPSMNHVLQAACSSEETAADALINGRYNGAFTRLMVDSINENTKSSHAELHAKVWMKMAAGGYEQHPQLEGPSGLFDRGLFG